MAGREGNQAGGNNPTSGGDRRGRGRGGRAGRGGFGRGQNPQQQQQQQQYQPPGYQYPGAMPVYQQPQHQHHPMTVYQPPGMTAYQQPQQQQQPQHQPMVQYPYPVPTPAYQQAQPPLQQNFYCAACGYNLGHWYSRNLCWPYQCPQCRVRTVDHPFLGGPSVYQQQAAAPAPPAPPQLGPELEWPETNIVHEHRRAMPNLVYQREEAIPSGRPTPAPKPHAGTAAFHTSRQWTAAGVVPDKVPPKFTKFSDRIVKMRATIQSKKYISKRQRQVAKGLAKLEADIEKVKKVKKETAETAEIAETAEGAEQSEGQTAQQMQQQEQRLGTIAADLALRDQMVRDEYQVVRAQAQINAAEEARSVLMEYIIAAVENLRWEMIAEWWPEFVRRRQNLTTPFGRGLDDNLRRQWASHHTAQTNLITARVREAHRYLREARDQLRHPDPTRTADSVRDNLGQLRQQHAARITALRQSLAEADEQHNQDFVGRPELQAAGAAESHPQLQLDQVPVHSAWRPLMVNLLSEPAPGETDDSKDSNDRSNESEDDDNEARNKRD